MSDAMMELPGFQAGDLMLVILDTKTRALSHQQQSHRDGFSTGTMLLVAVIIVALAFVCCFFMYTCRRRNESIVLVEREAFVNGSLLTKKFKLKDELKRSERNGNNEKEESSTECTICFNEFKEGDKIGWSENCRHFFHRDCVFQWLLKHKECPCCRRQFLPDENGRSSPAVATEQTDVEMGSVEAATSRIHDDTSSDLRSTNNALSAASVEEDSA